MRWPRWRGRGAAPVLAAGLAALEAVVLHATGMHSIAGIAPQVTAPPPYGVYHDLRWVLVFHTSWGGLAGELAALLAFRTLLNTGLVLLAWPRGVPHPPVRRLATSALLGTLLLIVLTWPWAALAGMGAAASLSWFVMASVLGFAMMALVINRAGTVPGWWRHPPTPASVGLALLTFLTVCAASAAISLAPGWWTVPVAAAGGLADAGLWVLLVRTVAGRPLPVLRAALTPVAVVVVPLVVIGAGAHLIGATKPQPDPTAATVHVDRLSPPGDRQVIYLLGYGTHYDGQHVPGTPPGTAVTYFSYRGRYPDGAPLPYGPGETYQSIDVLADRLARQVNGLHRRTGKPVALMATSEGTYVVRAYLRRHRAAAVHTVVLLSPLIRSARVYYPPRGTGHGWGLGMGWSFRALTWIARWRTGSGVNADQPFIRSILDQAPYFRNTMLCPVPGKRVVAFVPAASGAAVSYGHLSGVPVVEAWSVHGSLLHEPSVRRKVFAVLGGHDVRSRDPLGFRLVRAAAAGWQMPPLPLALRPAWHAAGDPDAALSTDGGCHAHG